MRFPNCKGDIKMLHRESHSEFSERVFFCNFTLDTFFGHATWFDVLTRGRRFRIGVYDTCIYIYIYTWISYMREIVLAGVEKGSQLVSLESNKAKEMQNENLQWSH